MREARIRAHEQISFKKSSEKSILSINSNEYRKKCVDLMYIQSLKQIDSEMLEQWYPDVMLAGSCKLKVIIDRPGTHGLTISDGGLRHGLAFDLFQK